MSESEEIDDRLSPGVEELYRRAKSGQINITDFFDELGELGIEDFSQAIHAANAFDVPLNETKEIYIKRNMGMDNWSAQFENVDLDPDATR